MEGNGLKGLLALATLLLITYALSFIEPKYNRIRRPEPCSFSSDLVTQDMCESAGCCWSEYHNGHDKGKWGCAKTCNAAGSGYLVKTVKEDVKGRQRLVYLQRSDANLSAPTAAFNYLLVNYTYETVTRLHVKITPVTADQKPVSRWEIPNTVIPRPQMDPVAPSSYDYDVHPVTEGSEFQLRVLRKSTQQPLFDSGDNRLRFLDQYLEVSTQLWRNASLYGFGETTFMNGLQLPRYVGGSVITMWNLDQGADQPDINLYGSHPFYMEVKPDGLSHGVLLLNSNGMDAFISDTLLTYKVIGGVLDFYFFTGPTPEAVIQQYQEVIGKPMLPPAWSLGFHQCRWGYENLDELEQVVDYYEQAEIPLDVIWSDIDHMDRYQDFTLDPKGFPVDNMQDFINNTLHKKHRHWVPIVDAGVAISNDYDTYKQGLKRGVFINDSSAKPMVGEVWPGPVHFPDFLNPAAQDWWRQNLAKFKQLANYSGIWLDMNEASNFCSGEVCTLPKDWTVTTEKRYNWDGNCRINCKQPSPDNPLFFPPYQINNHGNHWSLGFKTLPLNAVHKGGHLQYNTHNMFGLLEAQATYRGLSRNTGLRPFILSRSTFPSSGAYAAHWTGDNFANWDNLKWSIQGVLKSNLYGIPMAGADICGFNGESNEELCARWIAAGAFYTFSRNHNTLGARPQELYNPAWPSVTHTARKALGLRYRLVSYLLSQFLLANRHGGTVAKPLWFSWPADELARQVELQWMFGEAVMVTPVVDQSVTSITAYFPPGTWYNVWDWSRLSGPANHSLVQPVEHIDVHIRSGTITPMHTDKPTVHETVRTNITLVVALDAANYSRTDHLPAYSQFPFCQQLRNMSAGAAVGHEKKKIVMPGTKATFVGANTAPRMFTANHIAFACGLLYLEEEANLDVTKGRNLEVWYAAAARPSGDSGNITSQVQYNRLTNSELKSLVIEQVVLLGLPKLQPKQHYAVYMDGRANQPLSSVKFRPRSNRLEVSALQIPVTANFTLRWEVRPGAAPNNAAAGLQAALRGGLVILAAMWGAILLLAAAWWQ